jgi:competence protein ComEA
VATEEEAGIPRVLVALAVIAVVGVVGGWGVATRAKPRATHLEGAEASPKPSARAGGVLFVHVAGAVHRPGLYRLERSSRVDDAVRAAGGARADADLDALNLAAPIRDGDKVVVPLQGAAQAQAAGGPDASGKVNLNTAGVSDLQQLPGIGPSLAQRIIDHRTNQGPFRTVEDLRKVSGIGPKKFEQLASLVTV